MLILVSVVSKLVNNTMNKISVFLPFLLLAVTAVTAYNFDDPVFNKYLVENVEDLEESLTTTHGRSRREIDEFHHKCRMWKKKKLCCAEETFERNLGAERDLRKQCFKQIFSQDNKDIGSEYDPFKCDKVEKHRRDMTCLHQCIGQKKEILDEDGNVIEKAIREHMTEAMSEEPWFGEIEEKVMETCLNESKKAIGTSASQSCNPAGLKLVHCLFREIQLGCPQDQIKDEKSCSRIREKIKRHNGVSSTEEQ